jgi:polysaccharide export outer membrane protein
MKPLGNWDTARALGLLAGLLLAISASQGLAQAMREVLGAGDTVRVTAYRYPELTAEVRLSEDGKATLPLIGEVRLQGMTPDQAGKHIAERYTKGNFVLNPSIGVTVVQARSRQVSVLGFVNRPGRYVLDGTSARISDVIAMAGGVLPTAADRATVQVTRDGKAEAFDVDLAAIMQGSDVSKNIEVRSGDSVFVPKAPMFYIHGEVTRGGSYRLEQDMTVIQAISVAGGVTPRGTERRPQVRRKGADGQWKQWTAQPLDRIEPDDVIFVRESLF